VYFYRFSLELKDYLLTNDNLYKWNNPHFPEDISFFKDGYCWLSSITHENLYYIFCRNDREYKHLKSIGIEFFEKKFIPTPKKDLYFEDY